MNGAASPGQQVWTGRRPRSTSSPVRTTSCTGPLRTLFGCESAIDFSFFRPRTFSARPCGGCISSTSPSRRPTSSSESAPNARHIRRSVPNWLISSGCSDFGFSNSSAGPPALTTRSTISVTSRCGSTSAETRTSSPSRSRSAIQSRRSPGGTMAFSLGMQSHAASASATALSSSSFRARAARPSSAVVRRQAVRSRAWHASRCRCQPPSGARAASSSIAPQSRSRRAEITCGSAAAHASSPTPKTAGTVAESLERPTSDRRSAWRPRSQAAPSQRERRPAPTEESAPCHQCAPARSRTLGTFDELDVRVVVVARFARNGAPRPDRLRVGQVLRHSRPLRRELRGSASTSSRARSRSPRSVAVIESRSNGSRHVRARRQLRSNSARLSCRPARPANWVARDVHRAATGTQRVRASGDRCAAGHGVPSRASNQRTPSAGSLATQNYSSVPRAAAPSSSSPAR